jgi:hypothetical protein
MASLKIAQLRSMIDHFADVLEANNADKETIRCLRDLCVMFAGSESETVVAFLRATRYLAQSGGIGGAPSVASIIPALSNLRTLAGEFATTDAIKCLESFLKMLRMNVDEPISMFVANVMSASKQKGKNEAKKNVPLNNYLIAEYLERLTCALGDDKKFGLLFDELSANEAVTRADAVAIASQFCGQTAKSTSRPHALERIRERQTKLMKFKGQPSTSNRSAA